MTEFGRDIAFNGAAPDAFMLDGTPVYFENKTEMAGLPLQLKLYSMLTKTSKEIERMRNECLVIK